MNYSQLFVGLLAISVQLLLAHKLILRSEALPSWSLTSWPRSRPIELKVWLGFSIAIVLCVVLGVAEIHKNPLALRYETAPGKFVNYESYHGEFRYSFIVHDLQYHGYDSSSEHAVDKIISGEPFKVYYYPTNPNVNSASNPIARLRTQNTAAVIFGLYFIGLSALFIRVLGAMTRNPPTTST